MPCGAFLGGGGHSALVGACVGVFLSLGCGKVVGATDQVGAGGHSNEGDSSVGMPPPVSDAACILASEVVDTGATFSGIGPAVAPDGRLHLSYVRNAERTLPELWYAARDADRFLLERVRESVPAPSYSSLSFDPSGQPLIAHFSGTPSTPQQGRRTDAGWQHDVVGLTANVPRYYYIESDIGSDGVERVFYKVIANAVVAATRQSDGWVAQAREIFGSSLRASFTSGGEPVIAYYHREYTYDGGTMVRADDVLRVNTGDMIETVDSSGYDVVDLQPASACSDLELAVDVGSDGRYHVLYAVHAADNQCELRYAVRENGSWKMESLWTLPKLGFVDLHASSSAEPAITYLDGNEVAFAARLDAEWRRIRLGATSTSLARVVGDSERAFVLYFDGVAGALVLATINPACGERLQPERVNR